MLATHTVDLVGYVRYDATNSATHLQTDDNNKKIANSISFPYCFFQVADKPKKKLGIKSGKPICCCCPDTKKQRDECVVFKGEEDPECIKFINLHKQCLRDEGFDVK